MLRGIYSAATGMEVANQRHEVTAENLAHLNNPGYRGKGITFETFDQVLNGVSGSPTLLGAQTAQGFNDFTPGPFQQTEAPLDLALSGDAFFTVQGPNGPLYTRDGVFLLGQGGQVISSGGYPLLGIRGPVVLPNNASNILISTDGSISANGVPVDRLLLASFADKRQLQSVGTALFSAPPEAGQQANVQAGIQSGAVTVLQGFREQPNVSAPGELVSLILGQRHFEASQRSLRALSDSLQLVTRPQ